MNERDYILVSELTRLRDALTVLHDVCIANVSSALRRDELKDAKDWQAALSTLHAFADRLSAQVSSRT